MSRPLFRSPMIAACLAAILVNAGRAQITDEQARNAIQRGIAFLREKQNPTGGWTELGQQPGGITALCTLALLNAGEDVKSERIQKALAYLRAIGNPEMVYATSLQTMVFCAAEPNRDKPLIAANVKWLEECQITEGSRAGAWTYSPRTAGGGDGSNAQFAILALHEAERVGVEVDQRTWSLALRYWADLQNKNDGSWSYTESDPPTGSMTCAGIASTIICAGHLTEGDAQIVGNTVRCCADQMNNESIERAMRWMGNKFSAVRNPGMSDLWYYYYLYGVERVGRMTGQRFIGEHDWFRELAEVLVSQQDTLQGMWMGSRSQENNPLVATSLALLVLSKGRRPVVISKLNHGGPDWDMHRSGVPHLTSRVERQWKRDLTWQTIDLQAASAQDLLESPILFLSGREGLNLAEEHEQKLQEYIQQGGFIFAEACCGGAEFDRDFRLLMKRLFPDSAFRLLPADHPVWFAEQTVDPKYVKPLYGIEACCRTSVVYCPQDLSCYWELSRGQREANYAQAIKNEIENNLRIGANVVTYATNRELRNKLDRPQLTGQPAEQALDRGTLYVPKLLHSGGSDDAPNALPNLLQFLRVQGQMRVVVENRLISPTEESIFDYPILFMHGRRAFRFSAEERKRLATFFDRGGTLFADSICASPQFAESFRREIEAILPGKSLARIPPDHPVFSSAFRGYDLPKVTIRDPQLRSGDGPLRANVSQVSPVLEGLSIDDHLAVVFSPFDISCALENGASLDCKGYAKEDAAKLSVNVFLYLLQQ